MIEVSGPDNPKVEWIKIPETGETTIKRNDPFMTNALTLGEAISAYERAHNVTILPYDGISGRIEFAENEEPKYFWIKRPPPAESELTDIHVFRGEKHMCPKQDLNFKLEPGDVVNLGFLVC